MMTKPETIKKYIGMCGLIYTVYQLDNGNWAWSDEKGFGFTNKDLNEIMEYLKETKLIKTELAIQG